MSTPPMWRRADGAPELGPRQIIHIDEAPLAVLTDGTTPRIELRPLVADACDLMVMTFAFPAHYEGVVHSHPQDTVYVVRRGQFIVEGEGTYEVGDMRWVKANTPYGPERAGPDGCEVLLVTIGSFPPENGPVPDAG